MTIEEIRAQRDAFESERLRYATRAASLSGQLQEAEARRREFCEYLRELQRACPHPNGVRQGPRSEVHGTDVVHCNDCGFDRPMDTL